MKKVKSLYIYDTTNGTLMQFFDLNYERIIFSKDTKDEEEHIYASDPIKKRRVEIDEKPGKIFNKKDSHYYVVWLTSPDRNKAIEIIGNYILDSIGVEIRTHESFINRLKKERSLAYKLLKHLSEN
jgi:hypothetical protein